MSATYFVLRYSSIPSGPPSRPKPDCLAPPNGAAALEIDPSQSDTVVGLLAANLPDARIIVHPDFAGLDRFVTAERGVDPSR